MPSEVSGGDCLQLAQRREACQRLALELANALTRQVELVADRLERPRLALEAEAQLEDPPLALRKGVERLPHSLPPERLLGLGQQLVAADVGEEELQAVAGAGELARVDLERDRLLLLLGLGLDRLAR